MNYRSFDEYLDVKKHGGKATTVTDPPQQTVPDYRGEPNKEVKKAGKGSKNVKNNQVCEYRSFDEYLTASNHNGKGEMKEKPDVKLIADMPDGSPDDKAPPEDQIPPGYKKPGNTGVPHPYRAPESRPSKTRDGSLKQALGDMGPEPKWVPNVSTDTEKVRPTWGNEKGVPQVGESQLKGMSLLEVTQHMVQLNEECGMCGDSGIPMVTAFAKGKFHPNPLEAIKYVAHLAQENADIMEHLLHNLKDADVLGPMMKKPETYGRLAEALDGEEGPHAANCLARAMNDGYTKFMEDFDSMNENALGPPIGFGDDEEEDEDEDDEEDFFNNGGPDVELPDDEESDEDDDGNDLDLDDMGSEKEFGNEKDSEEPIFPPMDDDTPREQPKPKKPKRKFSHNHMIDAMGQHRHMRDYMKSL